MLAFSRAVAVGARPRGCAFWGMQSSFRLYEKKAFRANVPPKGALFLHPHFLPSQSLSLSLYPSLT